MKSVFNRGIAALGIAGAIGAGVVAAQVPSSAQAGIRSAELRPSTTVTTTEDNGNGTKQIVQGPHGTTVFHSNGKIVRHRRNGSKTTWHPNGTIVTHRADGTTVVHHANGTTVVHKTGLMGEHTTTVYKGDDVTVHQHM